MRSISLFLAVCVLFSCQQKEANTVVISGTITDPISEIAGVISKDRANMYIDSLKKDATFEIEFELEKPAYMSFKHGQESTAMYVIPGDRINISLKPSEFDESISYEGSSASNFLAKKYLQEEQLEFKDLYSLAEKDFLILVAQEESKMKDLLMTVSSNDFKRQQEKEISLQWATSKLKYKNYFEYLTNDTLSLSTNYFDFMLDFDVNDSSILEDEASYKFLKTYVSTNVSTEFDHVLLSNFDFISREFINQSTKNKLAYDLLKDFIKNENLADMERVMNTYKKLQSDTAKYRELESLAKEMSVFNEGNPALNFTYPDVNGDRVSLSDFKGSLVYVDVWATWCGPCKREIPFLLELEKDYQDKNIVFLSVSVDEDKDYEAWKTMLIEKEMGGVQLFASGWSKITEDYKINGIPRFMLFDQKGNIINVRATRPSNNDTRLLINENL
tara:strand:- start:39 stop:1373 length:1335 start_codon:yes stop_codon:yes gene_type:complete